MCGRFNLSTPADVLARAFGLIDIPHLEPRFNIAPTQAIVVILQPRSNQNSPEPKRITQFMHWGLIPPWAEDPSIGTRMINARCETLSKKPAFRNALKRRRCLIPAAGFFEWKQLDPDEKIQFGYPSKDVIKQPVNIRTSDQQPFAFAGLWEHWEDPGGTGSEIDSCTIITTNANDLLKPIHDRMPVIVRSRDYNQWLDCQDENVPKHDPDVFSNIFEPFPSEEMVMQFVGRRVNDVRYDHPECIKPIDASENTFGGLFQG